MTAQVFADFALSQRLEQAEGASCARFAEARARVQPEVGAESMQLAGAFVVYDGPTSPVTQTFGLGMFGAVTGDDLDRIETFFKERLAPVFHEVSPHAGVELLATLIKRGYQPMELSSVMYRKLDLGTAASNIPVRAIDASERSVWASVMAQGWPDVPGIAGFFANLEKVIVPAENGRSFIAEMDGVPVAAGSMNMENGVALLSGAATIPAARGKGAQSALLDARLCHAAAHGCDLAMMAAAPGSGSQRNAERNGFRIAYTRVKWCLNA